jgi:hypothetical protein
VSAATCPASRNRTLSTTARSVAFDAFVRRVLPAPTRCRYVYSFS